MTFLRPSINSQIDLSSKELLEISQEISREFAPSAVTDSPTPVSKIKLSTREMFEISEEIRQDFAPRASNNAQELVLLPVDPEHLYAYWNLGDDISDTTPKTDSGIQLTLRIFPEPNKNTDTLKTRSWFDVGVDSTQAQQNVFLSMRTHEAAYSATIGNRFPDNSLAPFAHSNITHVPLGKVIPDQFKESQIVFKPMPQQHIAASREKSLFSNNSASGQGNNE
jgi:hypothetical protein